MYYWRKQCDWILVTKNELLSIIIKVSKSRKQFMVASILLKKRTKLIILSIFLLKVVIFDHFLGENWGDHKLLSRLIDLYELLTYHQSNITTIKTSCCQNKLSWDPHSFWWNSILFIFVMFSKLELVLKVQAFKLLKSTYFTNFYMISEIDLILNTPFAFWKLMSQSDLINSSFFKLVQC